MSGLKVSVIIPAYNCHALIGATIASLQEQTLTDFEILVINDGSTDNTLDCLEKIKRKECRMKIITVANGGPANARNIGIKNAKAPYLCFLDSDDLIDKDMLEVLYKTASDNDLDEVVCGYTMEDISTKTTHSTDFSHKSFIALNKEDFSKELIGLIRSHLMYVVWNKLFKTEFLRTNSIYFQSFLSGEDRHFNVTSYEFINRFGCIDATFYHYFLRGQDTLANRFIKNRFEAAEKSHLLVIDNCKKLGIYDEKTASYLNFSFIKGIISCFTQLCARSCKLKFFEKKKYIAEILKNTSVQNALMQKSNETAYSQAIIMILRTKNKILIYILAKTIFLLQVKLNPIYLKFKHKEKK